MPNPPLFCHPVHNQPVSFIQNDISQFVEKFGTISYQNWGSCIVGQSHPGLDFRGMVHYGPRTKTLLPANPRSYDSSLTLCGS